MAQPYITGTDGETTFNINCSYENWMLREESMSRLDATDIILR